MAYKNLVHYSWPSLNVLISTHVSQTLGSLEIEDLQPKQETTKEPSKNEKVAEELERIEVKSNGSTGTTLPEADWPQDCRELRVRVRMPSEQTNDSNNTSGVCVTQDISDLLDT